MTNVIGLHGAKGSGKDHFYQTVVAAYPNYRIRKVAYADPLKNNIMKIFNLKSEADYDLFKRQLCTSHNNGDVLQSVDGRHVVREIGMMMREYDSNQFVKYVEETIASEEYAFWCITDVRFLNEWESIKHVLNGKIVKIRRKGYVFDGHQTERELGDSFCDYIIDNESNEIGKYEQTVLQVFNTIINDGPKVIKL